MQSANQDTSAPASILEDAKCTTGMRLAGAMALLAALIAAPNAMATTTLTINQTGSGWCGSGNYCNNTDLAVTANNDAQATINDWFAFAIPTIGSISSATLSIYESGSYGPEAAVRFGQPIMRPA